MHVKIHIHTPKPSNILNDYVDDKIRLALGLYRDKIQAISVFLTYESGPRRGGYTHCKITVKASGYQLMVAEATADDFHDAINICSHRIKRAVSRRFDHLLQQRRSFF